MQPHRLDGPERRNPPIDFCMWYDRSLGGACPLSLVVRRSHAMPLLSREVYLATMGDTRRRLGDENAPPFDFWPYFEGIPAPDFKGHDCSAGVVDYVWRVSPQPYDHVLVNSEDRNVFMVLVLDRKAGVVIGHRLLDLNCEYGLKVERLPTSQ
jgi:hypothetical protein